MEFDSVSSAIESILFAVGEPVCVDKLANVLEINIDAVKLVLDKMKEGYASKKRGIILREINGSYQLSTKPENYNYVKRMFEPKKQQDLSKAAYETLAIIAYNGPTTKAKVDSIRGVSSDKSLQTLLEKNLVYEAGRMEVTGRPILYQVTEEFFKSFGISSVNDLPILEVEEQKVKEDEVEQMDISLTLISDKNLNETSTSINQ